MRIDTLEIFHLGIPWKIVRRSEGSEGNEPDTGGLETVLVRLESDGVSGWGETSPGRTPRTTAEWAGGAFACASRCLGPMIVGRSFTNSTDLAKTFSQIRGNSHAKAAFDLAWWDCLAKQKSVPLPELLGAERKILTLGAVFDQIPTPDYQRAMDEHMERIASAVESGYSRLGLKIRPGWDVQMVSSVRREFGSILIHGDLEGALSMGFAEILYRFDDFFMKMLEQPLAAGDFVSSAILQDNMRTRICLDESIQSVQDAEVAVDLRAGRCINLKPQRVGGLTPAIEILKHAEARQTDCWVGSTPSTTIGARFCLAMAAMTKWDYPTDDFNGETILETDVADGPRRFRDENREGKPLCAELWTEPGIGVEPDPVVL
ncbi:MAG: enolase C-terminal domain-like protein, partial [Planctomycetia bacterium]|nr:enolase C-terminal domain-like protein [Planctomycetia bacterium]